MITIKCIECGNDFNAKRESAKFCSTNCRVKWNNKPKNKTRIENERNPPDLKNKTYAQPLQPSEVENRPNFVVAEKGLKETQSEVVKKADDETVQKINKDFGAGTVMRFGDKPDTNYQVISTGSLGLDKALGIGGLPRGRIVEIFGWESSGKTTIALNVIADAQKQGLRCLLVDAENAFDPEYAEALGVNISGLDYCQPSYGEQGLEVADRLIS